MKFGHLIEHNMKNNFLEKSSTKCGGENKIPKLGISLYQQSKVLYSLFLL